MDETGPIETDEAKALNEYLARREMRGQYDIKIKRLAADLVRAVLNTPMDRLPESVRTVGLNLIAAQTEASKYDESHTPK